MNFLSLDKKTMFLLGGLGFICMLFLVLAFILFTSSQNTPQNSSTNLQVLSFSPTDQAVLQPGKPGVFSVIFNKGVQLNTLSVSLSQTIIPTEKTQQVKTNLSLDPSKTMLAITSIQTIKPYSSYTLTISQKGLPKQILSQTYQVDYPIPSALPENNQELQKFLPYKTNTYELSYLKDQNVYVFNFIYNFNDPTDGDKQFENAKQNALIFIRSKDIDPDSVTIDWRYH